jgi:hypothetical protein
MSYEEEDTCHMKELYRLKTLDSTWSVRLRPSVHTERRFKSPTSVCITVNVSVWPTYTHTHTRTHAHTYTQITQKKIEI